MNNINIFLIFTNIYGFRIKDMDTYTDITVENSNTENTLKCKY